MEFENDFYVFVGGPHHRKSGYYAPGEVSIENQTYLGGFYEEDGFADVEGQMARRLVFVTDRKPPHLAEPGPEIQGHRYR